MAAGDRDSGHYQCQALTSYSNTPGLIAPAVYSERTLIIVTGKGGREGEGGRGREGGREGGIQVAHNWVYCSTGYCIRLYLYFCFIFPDSPVQPSVTNVSSTHSTVLEVKWVYFGYGDNVESYRIEIQVL